MPVDLGETTTTGPLLRPAPAYDHQATTARHLLPSFEEGGAQTSRDRHPPRDGGRGTTQRETQRTSADAFPCLPATRIVMIMTTTRSTVQHAHATADQSLRRVLDGVPREGWASPSPCEDWSAADVVAHLMDAQRDFLVPHGVDLGDRPTSPADVASAWRRHADLVGAALSDEALVSKAFDGFFGPTTVGETFERFYVWDMVVHRWDVARAVGAEADLTEAELDRIERGAEGFGEALHMEGICRPALDASPDASRETRVLAVLGRRS